MKVVFISVHDKFMLSALTIDSDNLSQQSIYSSLKQLKPEAQYRIRCILQSDQVNVALTKDFLEKCNHFLIFQHGQVATGNTSMANGGSGGGAGGDMAEVKKEAAKVTKKINEANEKLENLENQVKILVYGGAAILAINFLLLILFIFFS